MGQRSRNEKLKDDLKGYYIRLVRKTLEAIDAMYEAEDARKNPVLTSNMYASSSSSAQEMRFRKILKQLYAQYAYKFNKRRDVNIPDDLSEKLGDEPHDSDISELSFEDCKVLLWKIKELQEKLGHTSLETSEYEEEGYGESRDGDQ